MNRAEITAMLSGLLERYINPHYDTRIYFAKEVTFDYCCAKPIRVDFMRFKPMNNTVSGIEKGDFYCYEIKSSVEDFNSKNGHNFIGDYNYYVMTEELYKKVGDKIPYNIGVLVPATDGFGFLQSVRKAKRKDRVDRQWKCCL